MSGLALNDEASEAATELLHRRRVRGSLVAWCQHALTPFNQAPARHHLAIIAKLEAVSRGGIERLMILAPPGSAKSTYVSQLFPAWWLAQHPASAIIAASHTAELAERFGRRVRNMIGEHARTLGYGVDVDNAAAGRWETTRGGEYFAVGVGGAITGRRADLIILDDAVKSRAEADSQLVRDRTWEWWQSDALTRLKPGGRIVLVMTRWNEDDIGGRLENDMATGGAPWDILRLPMIAEPHDPLGRTVGEMLWPDWFTPAMLAEAQRDTRTFSALYQQRPSPETGSYFLAQWLIPVAVVPPRDAMRVFMGSDYAVTGGGGDFTVHVVVGLDTDDRLWLLDVWRDQQASDVWVEAFCDMVIQWKPMAAAEETGQIKSGIGPWLDRRCRERRAYVARQVFPTRGDKAIRCQSMRGRMALQGLHIPVMAPWRAVVEAELLSFPAGKHDDVADALGLVGQLLDIMVKPAVAAQPAKPRDSWDRAFGRRDPGEDDAAWKVV